MKLASMRIVKMQDYGDLIRFWRKSRRLSQLELSFAANISSKHVSFLETGRAKPSREMIIVLSNAMDIPLSERNVLLSLAGYSEAYSRMQIEQPEMKSVRFALTSILEKHEPYPAVVLDWEWNIVMANQTHLKLTQLVAAQQPNFPQSSNILELLFDPNGFRPFVENWEEVAYVMFQRIQRERMSHSDRHSNLLDRLMEYPDIPSQWLAHNFDNQLQPMIHLVLSLGDIKLKLFSTLASFGTAVDITMQELIIEQYFPVDDSTKMFFEKQ